ncbi:MAG: SRPBCC domain-containing protein [bacterium]|nr:SRPBCC domain-containing protein [bacterium]
MSGLNKMQVQINERELVFTRMFDAPRELVWEAWTKEEHLLKWWGPHGFTNKDCSVDLKAGGSLKITMMRSGEDYPCHLNFFEIVPLKRFVWTDKANASDKLGSDGAPPGSSITVLFEDFENKTKVTMILTYGSNEERDQDISRGDVEGWAEMFEKLDDLLKG